MVLKLMRAEGMRRLGPRLLLAPSSPQRHGDRRVINELLAQRGVPSRFGESGFKFCGTKEVVLYSIMRLQLRLVSPKRAYLYNIRSYDDTRINIKYTTLVYKGVCRVNGWGGGWNLFF